MSAFKPTPKQRANLDKLATYLEGLPEDYAEFRMRDYYYLKGRWLRPKDCMVNRQVQCGSAACAIGHGPAAGIRTYDDDSWDDYSMRVFGVSCREEGAGHYMFGPSQGGTANDAAARIRRVLGGKFDAA